MINNSLVKVGVTGINGKMGSSLIKTIIKLKQVTLGSALTYKGSSLHGMDVGKAIGIGKLDLIINSNFENEVNNFDILIDFTNPDSSLQYLKYCLKYKKNIVIGTTGFSKEQKFFIKESSSKIGIFMSNNFSIGMSLILKLLEKINLVMYPRTDFGIVDIHHRNKKDKLSSTAIEIKNKIFNSIKTNLKEKTKFSNCNTTDNNQNSVISSIRVGDIIGEHTMIFARDGEYIKISHKVLNRMIFAKWAIYAANWLRNKKEGIFDMHDIISSEKLKF